MNTHFKTGASFRHLYCLSTVCRQGKIGESLSIWLIQPVLYSPSMPSYQYQQQQHHAAPWQLCVPRVVWVYIANVRRYHCFWERIRDTQPPRNQPCYCEMRLEHPLIISVLQPETKFSGLSFLHLSHSHNSTLLQLNTPPYLFPHLSCLFAFLVCSSVLRSSLIPAVSGKVSLNIFYLNFFLITLPTVSPDWLLNLLCTITMETNVNQNKCKLIIHENNMLILWRWSY